MTFSFACVIVSKRIHLVRIQTERKSPVISKNSPDEWALSFGDDNVDPYIYHIEQNVFGLEYHRFTKAAYRNMMENEDPVKTE